MGVTQAPVDVLPQVAPYRVFSIKDKLELQVQFSLFASTSSASSFSDQKHTDLFDCANDFIHPDKRVRTWRHIFYFPTLCSPWISCQDHESRIVWAAFNSTWVSKSEADVQTGKPGSNVQETNSVSPFKGSRWRNVTEDVKSREGGDKWTHERVMNIKSRLQEANGNNFKIKQGDRNQQKQGRRQKPQKRPKQEQNYPSDGNNSTFWSKKCTILSTNKLQNINGNMYNNYKDP